MAAKKDDPQAVLRRRVAKVTNEPGIYRWKDAEDNILYVGKAKNLKKRMSTYVLAGKKHSPWTDMMVRQIADFDVTVVRSELEAFILESNLIKTFKPKYNIMLKDDKGYVYVRVSVREEYPRIDVVRRLEEDDAKYFGPFMGAWNTKQTLDMLDGILKFRACKKSLDLLNAGKPQSGAPCLDYQIGKCNGLCVGDVSKEDYRERIAEVEKFFRGNFAPVKKKAEEQMKQAAQDKKFEKAARIRDVLRFIDELESKQIVSDPSGENADVFGIASSHGKIHVVLLRERGGKLIEQVGFALKGEAENRAEALDQFLPQYYEETQDIPDVIIVGESLPDHELLSSWLRERRGKNVKVIVPERGKKSKLLEMAERNAEEKVEQQFAVWEAEAKTVESALVELASMIGLPNPPRRIEGYDISHLGGTATVGSMVVFLNGKAKRDHYRSFNMQSVKEGAVDDYKSLKETLRRRLKYLTDDLKTRTEALKKEGIVLGKAKKAEQKALETIIAAEQSLSSQDIDYKNFFVARSGADIIGCARLVENPGKILEVKSVWVKKEHRGRKLGQVLVRAILSKQKKGKVYIIIDPTPQLEEYYGDIGFRHVIEPPDVLKQKTERFHRDHPESPVGSILVFDVAKKKSDESFCDHPDLLLIDGGKGQLSAAKEALDSLNLTIPVAGLAKREEEIFLPGNSDPLIVKQDSPARFLLQRVRDEAHRFANSKREKRLGNTMMTSKLDEVEGIGDLTKASLLKRFGGADAAIAASDEDLLQIITQAQLQALRKKFPR